MTYPTLVESSDEKRYFEISARLTLDGLVATVEKLSLQELTAFVQRVVAILQARRKAVIPAGDEERALLQTIETRLPAEAQARLDALREKNRAETLILAEHAQLLEFVQQVERQDVARVEALVALAHKRGTTVSALLDTLDIEAA